MRNFRLIYEDLLRQNIAAYDKLAKDQAEINALKKEIAAIQRRREQVYGKRQSLFSVTIRKMDGHVERFADGSDTRAFRKTICF